MDRNGLRAAAAERLGAEADPSGAADLRWSKGSLVLVADPADLESAFERLKRIEGYKWILINRDDLFAANQLSIGSKVGIIDASGTVLKAPDVTRRKV